MRTKLRLGLVTFALISSSACSWFAAWQDPNVKPGAAAVDEKPTCRPKELDARGAPPWKVGDTTPGGWKVAAVDVTNMEYIRVGFEKGGVSSTLEVAFNEAGPGDWSTDKYKLMPAPDQTPPDALLTDAMAQLKTFAAAETGVPFVKKVASEQDPYFGLPPCP